MAAPTGNLNAEKWTVEALLPLLDQLEDIATQTEVYFIGSMLVKFRISRKAWSYWRHKFAEHPDISARIEVIEDILEQRLVDDALAGKIKPSVAMFCLRSHHDWPPKEPPKPPKKEENPPAPPKGPEPEPIKVEMPDGSFMIFPCGREQQQSPGTDFRAARQQFGPAQPG